MSSKISPRVTNLDLRPRSENGVHVKTPQIHADVRSRGRERVMLSSIQPEVRESTAWMS